MLTMACEDDTPQITFNTIHVNLRLQTIDPLAT